MNERAKRQSRLARVGTDQCIEFDVAGRMLNGKDPSVLMSDGYKFSMAQAGFPLRRETFYLSFRRGTHYIPFDLNLLIRELLPDEIWPGENDYLRMFGYGMSQSMEVALKQDIEVTCAPPGTWVMAREPIATITGPSFLVSWLEPLAIALHFPIQIATEVLTNDTREFRCTCEDEAEIVRLTCEAIEREDDRDITVQQDDYFMKVLHNAKGLVNIVGGDRIFEVGMRGATCLQMHEIALSACKEAGITRTSNVWGAKQMGMVPVGTTGHEHQQRWGNDLDAFRAIRDMRPQRPSYLFDTFDAMEVGIPAAVQAMKERPDIQHGVRFDSGDQEAQLREYVQAEAEEHVNPFYMFMDGINVLKARAQEVLCESLGITPEQSGYGSGGFLVCDPSPHKFTRNAVSAVYKLCRTGERDVMKFAVEGKMSLPGKPVIFRSEDGKRSVVGQEWESEPKGFHRLTHTDTVKPEVSEHTRALKAMIKEQWARVRGGM